MAIAPTQTAGMLWRGEPGYEEARVAGWNRRVPERFPDVIVRPAADDQVADAVRFARSRGLRVAVRAGGHSMCSASLHDGGMLIDLSRLAALSIDAASRTAAAGPSVTSHDLARALGGHGLAFPVAHHGSVPLSGFVLSGGLGWNVGMWGPACASLRRIEVVTADGERIVADDGQNSDILWAARGAGPNFFGVVTRFHLDLHPLPIVIRTSLYIYPLAEVEAVSLWATQIAGELPRTVELLLLLASAPPGAPAGPAGKVVGVIASAFASSGAEATRSLSLLETCPSLNRALRCEVDQPASFDALHGAIASILPAQHRYCEESLWSNHDLATVLPHLAEGIVGARSSKSLVLVAPLRPPTPDDPALDAAFAPAGQTFALCYGIWESEDDDAENQRWLEEIVARSEPLTAGRYIAETDVVADPSRVATSFPPSVLQRLRGLRDEHDPDRIFHSWLDVE